MRDIRFRAWDSINKSIYTISQLTLPYYNDTLMQFTGLLDKNGKEVYEGDIVKAIHRGLEGEWPHIYITKFGRHCADWNLANGLEDKWYMGFYFDEGGKQIPLGWMDNIEVIGNIYENSELLEVK